MNLWHGTGLTLADREHPLSDARAVLDLLDWALQHTTPRRARDARRMLDRTGTRLPDAVRQGAWRARQDALAAGIALPSWGVLRLAHRTVAALAKLTDPPPPTPGGS